MLSPAGAARNPATIRCRGASTSPMATAPASPRLRRWLLRGRRSPAAEPCFRRRARPEIQLRDAVAAHQPRLWQRRQHLLACADGYSAAGDLLLLNHAFAGGSGPNYTF